MSKADLKLAMVTKSKGWYCKLHMNPKICKKEHCRGCKHYVRVE